MTRPLRAGLLDRRIEIQEKVVARDAIGGESVTWQTFATRFASKREKTGREFDAADQVNAEVTTEWRTRFIPGLKREMRLVHDGQVFDIRHVAEINRREGHLIWTTAKVE